MHLTVTLVVLVLLLRTCGPHVYRSARTALIGVNVLGLLVFWLLPVAPPGCCPASSTRRSSPVSPCTRRTCRRTSTRRCRQLHVGWATWVLLQVWAATTRRSLRTAAATHLALTVVIVIATANHFTLDVIAGAVVALLAARAQSANSVTGAGPGARTDGVIRMTGRAGSRAPRPRAAPARPASRCGCRRHRPARRGRTVRPRRRAPRRRRPGRWRGPAGRRRPRSTGPARAGSTARRPARTASRPVTATGPDGRPPEHREPDRVQRQRARRAAGPPGGAAPATRPPPGRANMPADQRGDRRRGRCPGQVGALVQHVGRPQRQAELHRDPGRHDDPADPVAPGQPPGRYAGRAHPAVAQRRGAAADDRQQRDHRQQHQQGRAPRPEQHGDAHRERRDGPDTRGHRVGLGDRRRSALAVHRGEHGRAAGHHERAAERAQEGAGQGGGERR